MADHPDALALFHPLIRSWFTEKLGKATDIQSRAWPAIAAGKHVLVTAPTGSGKTLAAFLWAIDRLTTGAWATGRTRVLYVSPLKALNNDIRRNLIGPLEELRDRFREAGEPFPAIGVLTRSGDTPAEERRQMLRRPPEILITTPESLNVLLSSRNGRAMLTGIATVILDEIHAVIGTKRGTHLITAVERLVLLSGEFQRIALSATVRPLAAAAGFVGGVLHDGEAGGDRYEPRPVEIVASRAAKRTEIRVCFPPDARERLVDASWWPVLADAFREIILRNRATLLFANSRRTAEKVTRLINEGGPEVLAYAHHGSLSREIRLAVEQRLKEGELRAIVATSSLELGIDIGDLDEVVLIQTPLSISSAIQRIGRSGHGVGGVSRGVLFPTHGQDFLLAAVMAQSASRQEIEEVFPVEAPLDVLAQVLLSMTGVEKWDIDALYAFIRTSHPYRDLPRRQFDLVLEMLAGRFADTRLRELRPRIYLDRLEGTVQAREGALRLIYLSGGTIPDRGYYDLRLQESRARIGELDEEFVWERRVGDTFTLGTQVWRIRNVTHNDVEVTPLDARPGIFPFWRAEDQNRDFHFSERILLLLEGLNGRLDDPGLKEELGRDCFLEDAAADELVGHLRRQKEATGTDLPHRHHLLIEHLDDPADNDRKRVILHTLWGGRINRPWALALQAAWQEKYGYHLETFVNNDCILLLLPHAFSAGELLELVTPENIEGLLRRSLEASAFFGAKFRENAGRALLLPRGDFKRRLPLWLNRLSAKKLLDAVMPYPDFPILLETWRACLRDEFDLENLGRLLEEVRSGLIRISEAATREASPFAEGLIWRQTNAAMYEDDSPVSGQASRLSGELIREVLFSGRLRPRIPGTLVASLTARLQRTAPGYAPRSPEDLLDWTRERLFIPAPEWQALTEAMERDREIQIPEALAALRGRLALVRPPGSAAEGFCALENLPRLAATLGTRPEALDPRDPVSLEPLRGPAAPDGRERGDLPFWAGDAGQPAERPLTEFLRQWLAYYGPLGSAILPATLGLDASRLDRVLADLAEAGQIVLDELTEDASEIEVCDRENLEILLRMARKARRPSFRALPAETLPLFMAAWQGLTAPGGTPEDLQVRLDQLFGYPAPADAWEKQLLPARLSPYRGAWLDSLMTTGPLAWFGCGRQKIGFAFADDLELFLEGPRVGDETAREDRPPADEAAALFPETPGRYSFFDIARYTKRDSRTLTERLWRLAWQGRITNDAFAAVRQGIRTDFAPFPLQEGRRRPSRSGYNRWAASRPLAGNWHRLALEGIDQDPLAEAELAKDRVRQLLGRYGLLFRELLAGELPPLQWGRIFNALRLMELSGEILSGHFFEGIPGLQFISPEAFRFIGCPLPGEAVYWMGAADPASLCGIRLAAFKQALPSRLSSTHLVYRGAMPVLISRRNGATLEFRIPPEDPRLPDYLGLFQFLLTREFEPEKGILTERINGQPALESAYSARLREFGFRASYRGLELNRRY